MELLPDDRLVLDQEVLLSADESTPETGRLAIFLSRTLFISFRNAAILSGGIPTVGKPCRLVEREGLMEASTGAGARLREALAEAINEDASEGSNGTRSQVLLIRAGGRGGGGGGGGGGMSDDMLSRFNES